MTSSMTETPRTRLTTHSILIDAPSSTVYDVIADVTVWPYTFAPTVYAEAEPLSGTEERIRLWAFANGEVRSWTSRRELDPRARRVRFRQEISSPPVATLGGEWILEEQPDGRTKVLLLHDYRPVCDDPLAVAWIERAIETNSTAELTALARAVERDDAGLVLTFADAVRIAAPPPAVYAFLYDADRWPQRLPHVARMELTETAPGIQVMEMDTRSPNGSVHTTRSVRVCTTPDTIVYKQTETPEIMSAHTGRWTVQPAPGGGTEAVSEHTVVIRAEKIPTLLGAGARVADARTAIRNALGTNSRTTLQHAAVYAEAELTELRTVHPPDLGNSS